MTRVAIGKARPVNTSPVKVKVVKRFLRKEGCKECRSSNPRSSKAKWRSLNGDTVTFSDRGYNEIDPETLKWILYQIGRSQSYFYNRISNR